MAPLSPALPPPGIDAHLSRAQLGLPTQVLAGGRHIGHPAGRIARAPRGPLVGHGVAGVLLKGLQQLQLREALATSQVEDAVTVLARRPRLQHPPHGGQVAPDQCWRP